MSACRHLYRVPRGTMQPVSEMLLRDIHRFGAVRLTALNAALGPDALTPRRLTKRLSALQDAGWIEQLPQRRGMWRITTEALAHLCDERALPARLHPPVRRPAAGCRR